MPESKAIIVVGMHRSGTSALSGCLSELGVFMGKSLYGPQQGVNEKGFYENASLVEFNDLLFDEMLWSWDDPLAQCFTKPSAEICEQHVKEAVKLLTTEYGGKTLWGMKDPRTSLLLPVWKEALKRTEVSPHFIIMLRNPIEVAGSLKKRDEFSVDKSLMLWLNYTLSSVWQCLDSKYVIVGFDELLEDQDAVTKRINREFSLGLDALLSQNQGQFIDRNLRNHKGKSEYTSQLAEISLSLYNLLKDDNPSIEKLTELTETYSKFLTELSPILKEHLLSVKRQEIHFRSEFYEAYYSLWWKLSRPIKKLEELFRKQSKKSR
jgi:hypothetical protein